MSSFFHCQVGDSSGWATQAVGKVIFLAKKIDLFEKVKLVVPISKSRPRSSPCQIRSTLFKFNYVAAKCDTNSPERWLEYETVEPLLDISTEKSINIDQEYQLILSWRFMLYHSGSQAYIPVIHFMSRYLFPYF